MYKFFEYLKRKDLSERKLEKTISNWSMIEFTEFILESHEHIEYADTVESPTLFDFSSSSSLAGHAVLCSNYDCRFQKASQLANFAALYANRVVVLNPLPSSPTFSNLRNDFSSVINSLKILYYFKPLLEAGIILLSPQDFTLCTECASDLEKIKKNIRNTAKEIIKPNLKLIEIIFEKYNDYTLIKYDGPPVLFEHPSISLIMEEFETVKRKRKMTHILNFMEPILADVVFQNFTAKRNCANFLTDNSFQLNLTQAFNKRNNVGSNQNMMDSFSHNLPIVKNTNLKNLLKLRTEEGESFNVYRDALRKAINERLNTSENIHEIFSDIVLPELNRLDLTFKNNRKILTDSIRKDVVISSGFLALGLFNGMLTPHLNEMLMALGGYSFVNGVATKINQLFDEPEKIKNNDFYFLWKASKL